MIAISPSPTVRTIRWIGGSNPFRSIYPLVISASITKTPSYPSNLRDSVLAEGCAPEHGAATPQPFGGFSVAITAMPLQDVVMLRRSIQ